MVGWALNKSNTLDISAHRVVKKIRPVYGQVSFFARSLMQQLLQNEGIDVENNQIKHFKEYFWDPMCHLPPTNIENK